MFTVYVLHRQSLDRYYVGFTNDLESRLTEHNRKKGKYTDSGIPFPIKIKFTKSSSGEFLTKRPIVFFLQK